MLKIVQRVKAQGHKGHKHKELFKAHGITHGDLANWCAIPLRRMSQYMTGVTPTPDHIEEKLDELAELIMAEASE